MLAQSHSQHDVATRRYKSNLTFNCSVYLYRDEDFNRELVVYPFSFYSHHLTHLVRGAPTVLIWVDTRHSHVFPKSDDLRRIALLFACRHQSVTKSGREDLPFKRRISEYKDRIFARFRCEIRIESAEDGEGKVEDARFRCGIRVESAGDSDGKDSED
ncbi:hypothetical protein BC936DRAFT_136875 [Jimgerdemannia flammicorona]|uniref:Uncharacterized protein n=1 Tax=Jimgerdemannia flammicorona TaxID=994334 RepID=A0A433DJE5_9FUNG|nr:hypothetical protein BC936DRAFT_136875 [Jimgerdemannia flammicorona]